MDCETASNGQIGLNKYQKRLNIYKTYLEGKYQELYKTVNPLSGHGTEAETNSQLVLPENQPEEYFDPVLVIITDCNMPVMDGLEMSKKIFEMWDQFAKTYMMRRYNHILAFNSKIKNFQSKKMEVLQLFSTNRIIKN